jgi:hypothetical protein
MQVTEGIGSYAAPFVAVAASWCRERRLPLQVYGPLPLAGCDDQHPTPAGRDGRFGKVWLLAHAMREVMDAKWRARATRAAGGEGGQEARSEPAFPEWLLWLDSDVLVLDGHGLGNDSEGPDWLERVLATYGEEAGSEEAARLLAACRGGTRHEAAPHYEELRAPETAAAKAEEAEAEAAEAAPCEEGTCASPLGASGPVTGPGASGEPPASSSSSSS